jgi:paraquat-inducible protein B
MKVYLKLPELTPVIPVYLELDPGMVSWTNGMIRADAADVDIAVNAGLRAQLATQSLVTGQLAVNLDFHPEIPAHLNGTGDVPEIPTIPSDLQHIKDEIADLKLVELAERARVALGGVNQVVAELSGKLGPMADSLRQTSDAARVTMETATDSLRQVQIDASRALGDIDRLATSTQSEVTNMGKEIDDVLKVANRAAVKAESAMGSVNDLVSPRAPLRGDLEAAVRDLSASANSLRNFSHELERNPSALLLGRSAK